MEIAAARQQKRALATRDAFVGKREFLAACKKSTICPERAQKVLRERFQSELVAVRRLLQKALPPSSTSATRGDGGRRVFLAAAPRPRPRSEEEPPAEKKRKASPPLPVTQRSDQAPEKMMAGERELDNFLGQRNPRSREHKDSKMAEEEEDVDICGGVSPLAIPPAPLQLAEEEDGYVDICGEASPVVMPKVLGGSGPASSSSSDSGSDSSSSDSDSESGESVSGPAPAERGSDDVRKPAAAASALAVPDDPLDDDIFAIDGAWFNDFCGGSMDMSTRAGVDLLEMELDAESSVGRKQAVTAMNLSPSLSSSESEDDATDEHWLPSGSSKNSSGGRGTKRRLPRQQQQQQSAPAGQRKLQKTESAVVVEGGGSSNKGGYWCRHCGKVETPQWRAGPEGPNTLCNACGLRYKDTLAMATTTKRHPPGANRRTAAKCKNGRSVSVMPSTAVKKKR